MVPRRERCEIATHIEILPMKMSRTLAASKESDFGSVFRVQDRGFCRSAARTKLWQYSTAVE